MKMRQTANHPLYCRFLLALYSILLLLWHRNCALLLYCNLKLMFSFYGRSPLSSFHRILLYLLLVFHNLPQADYAMKPSIVIMIHFTTEVFLLQYTLTNLKILFFTSLEIKRNNSAKRFKNQNRVPSLRKTPCSFLLRPYIPY